MFEFFKRSNPFEQRAKSVRDIRKEWNAWDKKFDTKGKAVDDEDSSNSSNSSNSKASSENHHMYSPYNSNVKYDRHEKLPPV
jgi:hypothetical protein